MRQINEAGKNLIKRFEGLRLKPYKCPAGIWTIGYGHTDPEYVREDTKPITEHQADIILCHDLKRTEEWVESLAPNTNENQFSALVSFGFNVGTGALARSTLLKHVQAGRHAAAAAQFDKWVFGGGRVLPGLVNRRAAERDLYLSVPA